MKRSPRRARRFPREKPFRPVRLNIEPVRKGDPTFQPILTVALVWGANLRQERRVLARIIRTFRNDPVWVPGRPLWQARDEKTAAPVAESFTGPGALEAAVRNAYLRKGSRNPIGKGTDERENPRGLI
jgi:hypothetical protein